MNEVSKDCDGALMLNLGTFMSPAYSPAEGQEQIVATDDNAELLKWIVANNLCWSYLKRALHSAPDESSLSLACD